LLTHLTHMPRYAMREALSISNAEGLEALWSRHLRIHRSLWEGLRGLGLEPFVPNDADRLATVNTIKVRPGRL
jgi:aspartate aminotransferase-like enzyme